LVITYSEPFSAADIFGAAKSADAPGRVDSRHKCALVDMRAVDISVISGADSRKFAEVRLEKIKDGPSEPVAFLIGRPAHFGTLRMNNQWMEALGVRQEKETLITEDPVEALTWLGARTRQPNLARDLLLHFEGGELDSIG
jgi:hypothetical protein